MDSDKIAIFIPTLEGGGTEATMLGLAGGLVERGYDVDLLLKQKQGKLGDAIPAGIRVVDFNVPAMRHTFPKLIAYLDHAKPKAVVSALELPNITTILARRFAVHKPRLIISIRGLLSKQRPIYSRRVDRMLERMFYPRADDIVCVSRACAADAIRHARLPESKVSVIYNPIIDVDIYRKMNEPLSQPWLQDPHKTTIVAVGRLEPVKDHQTLLKAFKRVREERDAQLVILGEGSLQGALTAQAAELGIEKDLILPGFVANPFNILARANLSVLSSLREALPGVLIQAMACQCPVVSTACGGAEEVLADGKYGHLVPVGDDAAMAVAMRKVLDGDRRLAPEAWLAQFHKDRVIAQYQDLIERLPERR
ncbi:MAG: glycosyltransferase [Anaerolineae bacterium]|nr:glycosyltransferase [Anaerolineae bacterium]